VSARARGDTYTKMRTKESISRDLEDLLIKSSFGGSRSTFMILFFLKTIVEILADIRDQLLVPTPIQK